MDEMDFKPIYFGPANLRQHFGSRIKGELRRQKAMEMADDCDFDESIMAPELKNTDREDVAAIHPSLMGGEYLPSFMEGEVEIARVTLASTMMDVTSIRVRKVDGKYNYRIVNEYEYQFDFEPKTTDTPLSMRELIGVIDQCGLVTGPRQMNLPGANSLEDVYNFATVTSVFYPNLERHYFEEAQAWLRGKKDEAAREERKLENEIKLRKELLASYEQRIDKYVLRFGDETIKNPNWYGYVKIQKVMKSYIDDYVLQHGVLPSSEQTIFLGQNPILVHDFKDL